MSFIEIGKYLGFTVTAAWVIYCGLNFLYGLWKGYKGNN